MGKDCERIVAVMQAIPLLRPRCVLTVWSTFFCGLLVCARPVRAECGDYLQHALQASESLESAKLELLATAPNQQLTRVLHKVPVKPCNGPHCSRHIPVGSSPLASVLVQVEHWSAIITAARIYSQAEGSHQSEDCCPHSSLLHRSIYHPPRCT
jgi:hypothetical protein